MTYMSQKKYFKKGKDLAKQKKYEEALDQFDYAIGERGHIHKSETQCLKNIKIYKKQLKVVEEMKDYDKYINECEGIISDVIYMMEYHQKWISEKPKGEEDFKKVKKFTNDILTDPYNILSHIFNQVTK